MNNNDIIIINIDGDVDAFENDTMMIITMIVGRRTIHDADEFGRADEEDSDDDEVDENVDDQNDENTDDDGIMLHRLLLQTMLVMTVMVMMILTRMMIL